MFKINDNILYGSHGICTISDITEQNFGNEKKKYYLLHPHNNVSANIYVPMDNKKLINKMKRILSKEEIMDLIKIIPDTDSKWIENKTERNEYFRSIIASGDRQNIIKLIKAIYKHKEDLNSVGKKLHTSDLQFFKEAEKIIYEEFALVLDIKYEQVLPFLMNELQ